MKMGWSFWFYWLGFLPQKFLLTFIFASLRAYFLLLLTLLQVGIMTKLRITYAKVSWIGSDTWWAVLSTALGIPRVLLADWFLRHSRDVEAIGFCWLYAIVFLRVCGFWSGVLSFSGPVLGAAFNPTLVEFAVVYVIAIILGCRDKEWEIILFLPVLVLVLCRLCSPIPDASAGETPSLLKVTVEMYFRLPSEMSWGSSEIYIRKQILSNLTQNLGERELNMTSHLFATEFAKCAKKWKIVEKLVIAKI